MNYHEFFDLGLAALLVVEQLQRVLQLRVSKVQLLKLRFHRLALVFGFDQLLLKHVIIRSDDTRKSLKYMNSARSSASDVCMRVCARDLELGFV